MGRWSRWAAAAGVVLAACSPDPPPATRGENPTPPEPAPSPEMRPSGPVVLRATEIARRIERKYGLVEVWGVRAQERGRVVVYAVRMRLDARSDHQDPAEWQAHVSSAAQAQREAAVDMLKRTVRKLPRVHFVSVYQDRFLQPFWSREQIGQMREPAAYRAFDAWQGLVLSAEVLPGRPGG